MEKLLNKQNVPFLIINLLTILIVAIMFTVNQALAKPAESMSGQIVNSGVISYQGTLLDSESNPVDGYFPMTFRLYNSPTGSSPLWEEVRSGDHIVPVTHGLFNLMLGSLNPIPNSIWEETQLYFGISVGNDEEMTPRELVTGAPFAFFAHKASVAVSVPANSINAENIIKGAIDQSHAPSLIKSANGNNEIIRSGNSVFPGSDSNGRITINYPCFPNGARVFLATNGHWNAVHSQVVANNGAGKCATTIIISPPTSYSIRINWIAIGY